MKRLIFSLTLILSVLNASASRTDVSLNSGWLFSLEQYTPSDGYPSGKSWEKVNLPHTWNDQDAFDEVIGYHRGTGWYIKKLNAPSSWEGQRVMLHFEGANQVTNVYVNGKHITSHIGGYTEFRADLTESLQLGEENIITISVDNSYNADIPPLSGDFTFYGGIYRNIRLIVTSPVHFDMDNYASDGIFITTPQVTSEKAIVNLSGKVSNTTDASKKLIINTTIYDRAGNELASKSSKLNLKPQTTASFPDIAIQIYNPNLWSPDSPYLYRAVTAVIENGIVMDKIELPVGLRWFSFDADEGFFLNGQPLKLIGANRHQDFAGKGNALSDSYHIRDYQSMKDLGFNFVRLAHYPQAPEVYRICDKIGLLVWTEIPLVNLITDSEEFTQNSLLMQREHIRQTYNHPSIILYGYMNEILLQTIRNSTVTQEEFDKIGEATRILTQKLEDLTREEAPDRYSTMAIHPNEVYQKYGIADIPQVMGHNVYFGWYYEECEDMTPYFANEHAQHPKRPHIVSEFGPGADIHNHTINPIPWDFSEEYQIIMHNSYLKQIMAAPYIAGFSLWNFADFGAEHRGDATPFINQKGLVNFDRSEKDVAWLYRAWFTQKPVVYIASRNYTSRTWLEDTPDSRICTQPLTIINNAGNITLYHNGKKLAAKKTESYIAVFDVPFTHGENIIEAVADNGTKDLLRINFKIIPHDLSKAENLDLPVNVGAYQAFCDFETDTQWIPDRVYSPGSWGHIGGKVFTKVERREMIGISNNILGTDANPLFQTFIEGIEGYKFDVPDGKYTVTLCMVEYIPEGPAPEIIYNMYSGRKDPEPAVVRRFNILANGEPVIQELDLAKEYGNLRAATIDITVEANNGKGVELRFDAIENKPVLSGIRIRRHF